MTGDNRSPCLRSAWIVLMWLSVPLWTLGGCVGLSEQVNPILSPKIPHFDVDDSKPSQNLGAARALREEALIGGPAASGAKGDYVLYNDLIKVVIDDIPVATGFTESGGNIIDADRMPGGNDQLAQIFTYLDDTFLRHIIYDTITITRSGADGELAEIVVTGLDSANPQIVGTTRYQLRAGEPFVRLITEISNQSGETLYGYEVGDCLQWGVTEHYVPGVGFDLAGSQTRAPWIAGVGEAISYGLTKGGRYLAGPHGNGWSDMNSGWVDLKRGASVIYERIFVVGTGDTASISDVAYQLRKDTIVPVKGQTVDVLSRDPVGEAQVEAWDEAGKPVGFALSNTRGAFSMDLPPGKYVLRVTHRERASRQPIRVDLTRGPVQNVVLELTPPSWLNFVVTEVGGGPIPAKLTFEGLGDTPDPIFGRKSDTPGARNVWYTRTGEGEVAVPPGRYRVTASRGIEYDLRQSELVLAAGDRRWWEPALTREVDTGGYLSADLNQHSSNSSSSWVSSESVITANLAEGVEIVAMTDLDYVSDFLPQLQQLGLESRLKILSGQEILTREFGSVSTFPVEPDPSKPGNGAFLGDFQEAKEFFTRLKADGEARVIQINHPREGQEGYFNLNGLDPHLAMARDPHFNFGFNTLEVFNGKRSKNGALSLRDWFNLLNRGYVFTATGNSDSRMVVTQERGYPRNYLGIYSDNPGRISDQAVVSAVRDRHDVIVTNGPFIRAEVNGRGRIGTQVTVASTTPGIPNVQLAIEVQAPQWMRVEEIEIVANGTVIQRLAAQTPDDVIKFRDTISLRANRDTWYVVIARGSQGMEPVVPRYKGTTITPFGFTNPIWVDVDGDGRFTALFPRDQRAQGYIELPPERVD